MLPINGHDRALHFDTPGTILPSGYYDGKGGITFLELRCIQGGAKENMPLEYYVEFAKTLPPLPPWTWQDKERTEVEGKT